MVELWNVIVGCVASFILGLIAHSAWLHTKNKKYARKKLQIYDD